MDGHSFISDIGSGIVSGAKDFFGGVVDGAKGLWADISGSYAEAGQVVEDASNGDWGSATKRAGGLAVDTYTKPYKMLWGMVSDVGTTWWSGVQAAAEGDLEGWARAGTKNGLTIATSVAPAKVRLGGCRNSFVPGTLVVMADGSRKAIDKIRVGDEVLATDPETGRTEARSVEALILGEGQKDLIEVTVDTGGDGGDKTGMVVATDQHPFWLEDLKKWANAEDIQPGSWLRSSDGKLVKVLAVRAWTQFARVHNLTVAGIHTYYVVADDAPVLVHNCGGAYDWKPGNRPGLATDKQAPLPSNVGIKPGEALRKGEHHYVVMKDGSLRAMHNDDMFGLDASAGHTSLAGNRPVHMAGTFVVDEFGRITKFGNWSGRYGPQNVRGFTPLEDIARAAFKRHGLSPGVWEYDFS
ncbi:polymorphic toxin-type HINT domain-containing protein [Micromonospora sp. NPDC049048]|uniref:polymorphic toxin-type HINT domain-containing protein n=1 Tax=Micromonospora sp. NPDC049048 TaxID=3364263 RepID=UPI00371A9D26